MAWEGLPMTRGDSAVSLGGGGGAQRGPHHQHGVAKGWQRGVPSLGLSPWGRQECGGCIRRGATTPVWGGLWLAGGAGGGGGGLGRGRGPVLPGAAPPVT